MLRWAQNHLPPSPTTTPTSTSSQSASPSPTPTSVQTAVPSPTPTASSTTYVEGSQCPKVGVIIPYPDHLLKCWYQGAASTAWVKFPLPIIPTLNDPKYKSGAEVGKTCDSTGDRFDVSGGYLECRFVHSGLLQWVMVHTPLKSFTNAVSPNGVDVCKLQNSSVPAKTGRDLGQVAGFPFVSHDYFGYDPNKLNIHKALIFGVDFPELRGRDEDLKAANEYDKKMMKEWYSYFSNGKFIMDATSIDHWFHSSRSAASFSIKGTYDGLSADANSMRDGITQYMIDLITNEVDLRNYQTLYLIFPDGERTLDTDWVLRNRPFKIKEGAVNLNVFGWGLADELMSTLHWAYYIHETLHDFPLIQHAPGNGWPFSVGTNQSGISLAMNPWEQFRLGWLPDNQIFCIDKNLLSSSTVSITPIEREDKQTKMIVIKLSENTALVVESHGIDKWSSFNTNGRAFPPGFYGVMTYLIDLKEAGAPPINRDGGSITGDNGNDPNYPRWAYYLKVDGSASFLKPAIYTGPKGDNFYDGAEPHLEQYVAQLGDSFTVQGIKIELVGTGDFETIRISRT